MTVKEKDRKEHRNRVGETWRQRDPVLVNPKPVTNALVIAVSLAY